MLSTLLVSMLMLGAIHRVTAHGGELHDYNLASPDRNFVRYKLASCPAAAFAPPTVMPHSFMQWGDITPQGGVTITSGTVDVWVYLDGNCTDRASTSFEVNNLTLAYTADGSPYSNRSSYGYGFSGNCSNPVDLYRNDVALGDDRFNLAWWASGYDDNQDGVISGSAPNTWVARRPDALKPPAGGALTSIILIPNPMDGGPLCCTLQWEAPPPKSFFSQGSYCFAAPPPPKAAKGSSKKKSKKSGRRHLLSQE